MEKFEEEYLSTPGLEGTIPSTLEGYSPDNPPWGSIAAGVLWLVSILLIVFLQMAFVFPYIASQDISMADAETLSKFMTTDPTAILISIATVIPAHILTIVLAWFIVTKFNKHSFKEMLGWHWGGYNWWQVALLTVALVVSVFVVAAVTITVFGKQENDFDKILKSSRYVVLLVAFMATFSAPITEEIVYRGVMYSAFQRTLSGFNILKGNLPVVLTVVIITFLFAGVHYFQYWGDPATLITITFLSLIITLIRTKTGSVLPCIFFHFVINGIQAAGLVLQPYLPENWDPAKSEAFFFLLK